MSVDRSVAVSQETHVPPILRLILAVTYIGVVFSTLTYGLIHEPYVQIYAAVVWFGAVIAIAHPKVGSALMFALWLLGVIAPALLPTALVCGGSVWIFVWTLADGRFGKTIACISATLLLACLWFESAIPIQDVIRWAGIALVLMLCGNWLAVYVRNIGAQHRLAERRAYKRFTQRVTAPLHDVTCNDLCYALHQLDSLELTDNEANAVSMAELKAALQESLGTTRASIRTLRTAHTNGDSSMNESETIDDVMPLNIARLAAIQQARLESLGYYGIVLVEEVDSELRVSSNVHAIVTGFVTELFGNALKYGNTTGGYSFTCGVDATGNTLQLSMCNQADGTNGTDSTGSGLRHYSEAIAHLGGQLTLQRHNNLWTISATVPLGQPHADIVGNAALANLAVPSEHRTGVSRWLRQFLLLAALAWMLLIALSCTIHLYFQADWSFCAVFVLLYLISPGVALVLNLVAAVKIGMLAWCLTPITGIGGAVLMLVLDSTRGTAIDSALFGCILGLLPAIIGTLIGMVVRRAMIRSNNHHFNTNRALRWKLSAIINWGAFSILSMFVALMQTASATPIPWGIPILAVELLIATGCTTITATLLKRTTPANLPH